MQEYVQRKRFAKKKWDTQRTEERGWDYREMQPKVKVEGQRPNKGHTMICMLGWTARRERLIYTGWRGREIEIGRMCNRLGRLRRDGSVLTDAGSVMRRWKVYFEYLRNEENEREQSVENVTVVDQEVVKMGKAEERRALKRMKSGKTLGSHDKKYRNVL